MSATDLTRAGGGRHLLVVTTVEHPGPFLQEFIDPADTLEIVVPVVRQGILDWLANDERAFTHAQAVAQRAAEELPGETVDVHAGEADVELAIRDALATFPADEILVAVHDDGRAGLVESLAVETVSGRQSIDGVPIRFIVVRAN